MGRYKTKLEAVQEANKNILKNQEGEYTPGDDDNGDELQEGPQKYKTKLQAITAANKNILKEKE